MKFVNSKMLNININSEELLKILPYENINCTDIDDRKTKIYAKSIHAYIS